MNNSYEIEGTIFKMNERRATGKDGKEYVFKSIILEVSRQYTWINNRNVPQTKEGTTLPEFHYSYSMTANDDYGYKVGDRVLINFHMEGKEISSTWHKTEAVMTSISRVAEKGDSAAQSASLPNPPKVDAHDDMALVDKPSDDFGDDLPF